MGHYSLRQKAMMLSDPAADFGQQNMSKLHQISIPKGQPRATIVFVHGLSGHPIDTWRAKTARDWPADNAFWPKWLVEDVGDAAVYTLEYPASVTDWTGSSMPLQDRAGNVLEHFLVEPRPLQAPIVFICHSLGGLVVKQMVRKAEGERNIRPESDEFLKKITGTVFIATPHTGATLASTLTLFGKLARLSAATQDLIKNDPSLRDLNIWYRNWCTSPNIGMNVRHRVFYEMNPISGITTVTPDSADPGLPNASLVGIDSDHIQICKPADRSALVYKSILDFVRKESIRSPFV